MKKIRLAFAGFALVAALSLAGCGKSEKSVASGGGAASADAPGWKASADKPVKFDWYINFSWFARHWGDSKVSKYITEKTGVDVNFIVPAGNELEKLNAMIAGDALPDLITLGWYEAQVPMMIDAGLVEPLDVLAEKYDPYFFKVTDADKLGWYTVDDGHVYGYPNASYTANDYKKYQGKLTANETFLVRKDMYEALGTPDMTTPEGFLAALRAAKAKFPTVDGQPLIPFGTNEFLDTGLKELQVYLSHFLALPPEKDGKFVDYEMGNTEEPEYTRWPRRRDLSRYHPRHPDGSRHPPRPRPA